MEKQYTTDHGAGEHQPYRLGVALSGGGARGFAHAGALKALDEAGLKVDVLAGVSAGSIIAVLYAAGIKPDTILEMFTHAKFFDMAELSIGKGGFMRIDRIIHYITKCLGPIKRLEQLPIPTYVGATNFDEGCPVIFSEGEIGPRVQASCSIPIVILPVTIDGVHYVDGGVLRNLPAWTIRDKCDKLIGINVSPVLHKRVSQSVYGAAMRTYNLLAKSNQQQDMDMCDLVVTMEAISHHKVFNLNAIEKVFNSGYERMKEAIALSGLDQKEQDKK